MKRGEIVRAEDIVTIVRDDAIVSVDFTAKRVISNQYYIRHMYIYTTYREFRNYRIFTEFRQNPKIQ